MPVENKATMRLLLQNICSKFGLKYGTLHSPSSNSSTMNLVTTYPQKWIDFYITSAFQNIDPVIRISTKAVLPINWLDISLRDKHERELFSIARNFDIGSVGITVPVRSASHTLKLLSFTSEDSPSQWTKRFPALAADIAYAGLLISSAYSSNTTSHQVQSLSPREIEVLAWVNRGKTAWESGYLLGISQRTVENHIRNACLKLGVANKTRAAFLAAEAGVFNSEHLNIKR